MRRNTIHALDTVRKSNDSPYVFVKRSRFRLRGFHLPLKNVQGQNTLCW